MGEEGEGDGLLWGDDQSWAFPKLEEDCGGIKAADEKGKKRSAAESEDHEVHIWTERERRKKMRNMFSNLHALLPHVPPKADKSTIVDEGVKYIKHLEQQVEELEKMRKQRLIVMNNGMGVGASFQTWASPNVILSVCGRDAQISVCSSRRPGLFSALCSLIHNHNLQVVSAQTSSDRLTSIFIIHARHAFGGSDQFPPFQVEEIFKQAATQLMTWLNS